MDYYNSQGKHRGDRPLPNDYDTYYAAINEYEMLPTTGRGGSYLSLEPEEEEEEETPNYNYNDVTPAEVDPSDGHNNNNDTSANEYAGMEGFVRVEGPPATYANLISSHDVNWNN